MSFSTTAADAGSITRALQDARAAVKTPAGLLVFVSGAAAEDPTAILEAAREVMGPVPAVLAIGSGVRTAEAEHEGSSAIAGVLWRQGRARSIHIRQDVPPAALTAEITSQLAVAGGTPTALFVFGQSDYASSRPLTELTNRLRPAAILGAVTPQSGAMRIDSDGQIERGPLVGLALYGVRPPVVRTASACKLITQLAPVTATQGSMVLTIADRPALQVLSAGARALHGHPLVLAVVARAPSDTEEVRGEGVLIRGIRGVDPSRGGVLVSEEVEPGMLMGFGALDPGTAKTDLDRALRGISRELAGAAPQFGIMLSCAGRGANFYSAPDVEVGMFRERFRQVPLAGALVPFEIAPFGRDSALHMYTTAIALFSAPS